MNILIDASTIKSQGGINHLLSVIEVAKSQNANFFVISNDYLNKKKLIRSNFIVDNFPSGFFNRIYKFFYSKYYLNKLVKKRNISKFISLSGFIRINNIENINFLHNLLPHDKSCLIKLNYKSLFKNIVIRYFQRKTFKKSEKLIYFSYESMKISKINNKSYKIIPHFIGNNFYFNPKKQNIILPQSKNKIFIAYPSEFFDYKKHINLIKIFEKLILKKFNLQLIFISKSNPGKKIKKLIEKNKKDIQVLNFKTQKNLIDFYRKKIDLLFFPSECESFGYITYEALASGIPVISSTKSISSKILPNYKLFFDSSNLDNSVIKIMGYFKNPSLRYENILYAQKEIKYKLSKENNLNEMKNYIFK